MKIINEIKFEMQSNPRNEAFARVVVASFAAQLDVTVEELSDIKTAVSEAVTNSIVHGYANSAGVITLECRIYENFLLEIIIADAGKGIENIEKAREPLFTTQPEFERSGMGFTVMETFMDEVAVVSAPNQGAKVTLRKVISPKQ